jgi:hypothetical protein
LYFPDEQSVQGTVSERSLNFPARQAEQGGSPLVLENPAMQKQTLAPGKLSVFGKMEHDVQVADDAAVALNEPAAHATTLPTTPVNPALARQSVSSSEPSALPLFGGQASQVSAV